MIQSLYSSQRKRIGTVIDRSFRDGTELFATTRETMGVLLVLSITNCIEHLNDIFLLDENNKLKHKSFQLYLNLQMTYLLLHIGFGSDNIL